jgi:hypothetical protein
VGIPQPPATLSPRLTIWPASQPLFRVFRLKYEATAFNPGLAGGVQGRFHFFDDLHGKAVPTLYGAETAEAAFAETIFRDLVFGAPRILRSMRLGDVAIARLALARDLNLIELYGHGLQRLGLTAEQLTATPAFEYQRTVVWARALHTAIPGADGIVWMSRQFNTSKALMLFGDRVKNGVLTPLEVHPLASGEGLDLLRHCANEAGISIL